MRISIIFLFICVLYLTNAIVIKPVMYRDVKSIVLDSEKQAVGKRSSIPQMKYVGSSHYQNYLPTTMQCSNMGWDGSQYTWECKAQLPNGVDLDRVEVGCENWDLPVGDAHENDIMTAGSCGVEYTLRGTIPPPPSTQTYYNPPPSPIYTHSFTETTHHQSIGPPLFGFFCVFGIIMFIGWLFCLCDSTSVRPARTVYVGSPSPSPIIPPTTHYVPTPSPAPTVIIDSGSRTSSYNAGYWDGVITNSLWNSFTRPRSPPSYSSSSSTHVTHYSAPSTPTVTHSSSAGSSTHSSSAFGGTKRR